MTPPEFILRNLREEDYDALVELWNASGSGFQVQGRERGEAISRHLTQFAHLSFAAVSGDRFVGTVLGTHDGRKGWINRLAVRPEFRRKGVAAALVKACDAAIRREGIEIVAALVESDNHASTALFRKLGYSDAIEVRYFRNFCHEQA